MAEGQEATKAIPVTPIACANWKDGESICPRQGKLACGGCMLVLYCDRQCQARHWSEHKKSCKSPLMDSNWRPAWDQEARSPAWAFMGSTADPHHTFGRNKYLWGNSPAMDLLQLRRNEGTDYDKDIAMLFAASGDLRNVVKTVQSLPHTFNRQITATINDVEPSITARNAILLLLALSTLEEESDQTSIEVLAEALIHVWYSATITGDILSRLQSKVKPLVEEMCQQVTSGNPGAVLGKTWNFKSGASLRLVLTKEEWARILMLLDIPEQLTASNAREIRRKITLAPDREDHRHQWYFKDATPSMRIAKERFREDGLVLPFGHPRLGFDYPNPTIYRAAKDSEAWPFDDQADPLGGWSNDEISATPYPAAEDLYGRLFIYLRGIMTSFIRKIATGKIRFQLFNVDPTELDQHLEKGSYDRIEISNVPEYRYSGAFSILRCLSTLLRPPQQNRHATIVIIYPNAVQHTIKTDDELNVPFRLEQVLKPLPNVSPTVLTRNPERADVYRNRRARNFAFDMELVFRSFAHDVEELHIAVKESHTIVDPWPTRPKLPQGQPGAKEEFALLLSSPFTGLERHVELKRLK
ncbi:hypothetical protein Hte_009151 [Hypoxylon texense]